MYRKKGLSRPPYMLHTYIVDHSDPLVILNKKKTAKKMVDGILKLLAALLQGAAAKLHPPIK